MQKPDRESGLLLDAECEERRGEKERTQDAETPNAQHPMPPPTIYPTQHPMSNPQPPLPAHNPPRRPPAGNEGGYVLYLALILVIVVAFYVAATLTTQRMACGFPRRELRKLQATVLAQSGLEYARARAAEYDGVKALWQAEDLELSVEGVGKVKLCARSEGGWLHVEATGIKAADTVAMHGVLGAEPAAFTEHALNVESSGERVVVGPRGRVEGDIASAGGLVETKGSGVFKGTARIIDEYAFSDSVLERQMRECERAFRKHFAGGYRPDSLRPVKAGQFMSSLGNGAGDMFVDGDLHLEGETLDFGGRALWVNGELELGGDCAVSDVRARVRADVLVEEEARIDESVIAGFRDVRIGGYARISATVMCAETLQVKDNAAIRYPSVLYLSALNTAKYGAPGQMLIVEDRVRVTGTVLTGDFRGSGFHSKVIFRGRSRFEGLMYVAAAMTPYARFQGSVWTHKLLYRRQRTVYDGYLMETALAWKDVSGMVVPLVFPGEGVPRYVKRSVQ